MGGRLVFHLREPTSNAGRRRLLCTRRGQLAALGGLAIALAWLAAAAGRVTVAAWGGGRDAEAWAALADQLPGNSAFQAVLARADLAAGRPRAASKRLEAALRDNALSAFLWLDLGRSLIALGDTERAVHAALGARRRAPASGDVCYDAGVLLLQADQVALALDALRCALEFAPRRAMEVYALAWAVLGKGELVRDAVPDTADGWRTYLHFLRAHRPEEVSTAWAELARRGATSADRLYYVNFLIGTGRGSEAAEVWATAYGPRGRNLVFNGSFESDSVGGGLDWIMQPCDGAEAMVTRMAQAPVGTRVLQVRFDGANVDFHHVYQIVPVAGGRRYQLRATVRAERLTSASGVRLAIAGYRGCAMGRVDGREWRGTTAWSEERLSFTAPARCSAIAVQIRRTRTERFDRNISGRFVVDDVKLVALGDEIA